ncbi:MAG: AAA family ATPase [Candidatus Bathyarchaeia archaeon]|jgi:hypothetical protein
MKNPFNPGSGVPPPYLAGRQEQIKKFDDLLDNVKGGAIENVLLTGLRGTGKTVLLDEFQGLCISKGFLPIRRSQFSDKYCNSEDFEQALAYDVRVAIETFSHFAKFKRGVGAALSLIKPKSVGIPDLFYYEPAYETKRSEPFEDYLTNYLTKNWPIFENAGYSGVVFLYDEFHTVIDRKTHGQYVLSDFIAALNEAQRKGSKYVAVFCGLPNLRLNVKKARSYSERMFSDIVIGNLAEEEARLALDRPLEGADYKFSKELVDDLIHDTGGYPYFIQFFGKGIITNAGVQEIGLGDYKRIKPGIIKDLDIGFFDPRFELASNEEQAVLCGMSMLNKENIPFEFIKKATGKNRESIFRSLDRLEKKGMTYNYKRGIYRFSVPMFREYLRRRCV